MQYVLMGEHVCKALHMKSSSTSISPRRAEPPMSANICLISPFQSKVIIIDLVWHRIELNRIEWNRNETNG